MTVKLLNCPIITQFTCNMVPSYGPHIDCTVQWILPMIVPMLNLYLCSNKDGLHFLITSSTYKIVNKPIRRDLTTFFDVRQEVNQ